MNLAEWKESGLQLIKALRVRGEEEAFRRLLSDLYPDTAHFIYELFQNAEDAKAELCRFVLSKDALEFEHNGERLFSEEDVKSITSFGNSTKRNDPTSIGKFGVGFKAVFAYTNTPEIHSGKFHFRIHDLVVPETNDVQQPRMGERETRFIFPFNHPKKLPRQAVDEVEDGLRALGDNTLLFLSHIRKIEYMLPEGAFGSLERIDHEGGRIEIRASHPGGNDTVSHWLRFQTDVDVEDEDGKPKTCRIAIAFSLVEEEDKKKRRTWKIVPLDHGQVSIYFPADKENSSLRFHIHAPFASTVARDSVRDCKANHELRDHLADLIVESLAAIRDQGLLTVGFLAVLPNPHDNLPPLYEPIRKVIVSALQNEPLTPTRSGTHAPSSSLFRGPAKIAEVLNDDDLSLLTGNEPPLWVANPPQQNQREDRFLDSLEIDECGWKQLKEIMNFDWSRKYSDRPDKEVIEDWISHKEDAWLLRFYALLGEACDTYDECVDVSGINIVRVVTDKGNEHVIPCEAFFQPEDGTTLPPDIRFVKSSVYSTGRSEPQKKFATSFLENIGVHPFDATAMIELRLTDYESPPEEIDKSYFKDIKQFIAFWKKNPSAASIFSSHTFLLDSEMCWKEPTELCLDNPYLETGLAEVTEVHDKDGIWDGYPDELNDSQLKDFIAFLKATGVMHELKVESAETHDNPHRDELRRDYYRSGTKWMASTAIDEDYSITDLDEYLAVKSIAVSRLIWDAIIRADEKSKWAHFSPNQKHRQQYRPIERESQLVYHLKRHAWIPDNLGEFRKPEDMTRDDLRTDFPYNDQSGLLSAIGFGENAKRRSEEYQTRNQKAQEIGFDSAEEAAEIARFMRENGWSIADIRAFASQHCNTEQSDNSFPSSRTPDPERRKGKAHEQALIADDKVYEERMRTVRPSANANSPAAKEYLRNIYQNEDGDIICQLCHENMPFQLDGVDYFEKQPFIRNTAKEHKANNLALCPNCSAEFWYTCATDEEEKKGLVLDLDERLPDDELWIELDMPVHKELRFTQRHLIDLKEALLTEDGAEAEDADFDEQEAEGNEEPAQPHKPLPIPNGKVDKFTDSKGREVLIERNPVKQASPATSVKSTLLKCPYCDYNIRQEKYQTHIKEKCPKRPAITGLSHTTQQPLRSAIPRCRFCDSPAIAGSDVCYSCGG